MMKNIVLLFIAMSSITGCGININGKGSVISHDQWTVLLKKHVGTDGLVDYKGFLSDKGELQSYLDLLSENAPSKTWTENDKIAYWLNAYNAFTIQLIINNYPLKSIKDLGGKKQIIFINTPWDIKFFKIGDKTMTLNRLEHRILRSNFQEPRIHFALNCASLSCPKLRREAYAGSQLNEQLTDQAIEFLTDKSRNQISAEEVKVSAIFDFYGNDMVKWSGKTLIKYINQYSGVKIANDTELKFLEYDWNLNEQMKIK